MDVTKPETRLIAIDENLAVISLAPRGKSVQVPNPIDEIVSENTEIISLILPLSPVISPNIWPIFVIKYETANMIGIPIRIVRIPRVIGENSLCSSIFLIIGLSMYVVIAARVSEVINGYIIIAATPMATRKIAGCVFKGSLEDKTIIQQHYLYIRYI